MTKIDYNFIIDFWFNTLSPQQHFVQDDVVDDKITTLFSDIHAAAAKSELFGWRKTALGRLAEIIILDQFSRNIYRNSPKAFENDFLALALSQESVLLAVDKELNTNQRLFLYMPYMHSESQIIHEEALKLFNQDSLQQGYEFELKHKRIIDRFGRYPHRNAILKRKSTSEEIAFLKEPGSSF